MSCRNIKKERRGKQESLALLTFFFQHRNRALRLTAHLALFISFSACTDNPKKNAAPPKRVTLAYSTLPNSVLVHIAFKKGYFLAERLEVVPQPYAFGKAALGAMLESKADMATAADTPIVFAVLKGVRPVILATIQTANKNEAIVARSDRGIKAPSDLRKKKIGLLLGTTGEFFMDTLFGVSGIRRKDVTIIDSKPEKIVESLIKGEVDAVSIWNPAIIQLQKALGDRAVTFYGENIYTETFCITTTQDFIRKKLAVVKRVLKALVKAEEFVKKNPLESQQLVADFTGADKAMLGEVWNLFHFSVKLDQALLSVLEDETRWAIKSGKSQKREMPNYLDYIYPDALYAVKPEAVKMIR